jgi:hypothetical protein
MNKQTIIIAALSICILLSIGARAKSEDNTNAPTMSVTKLDISDKILKLSYEIKNGCRHDIWICEDTSISSDGFDFEVCMDEDNQTLLIRRRLDITTSRDFYVPFYGRYERLRPGGKRSEYLLLSLPIESRFFWNLPAEVSKGFAKSLALEIGYYPGNMPEMIRGFLKIAGASNRNDNRFHPTSTIPWFTNLLYFDWHSWPNGLVRQRGEEIILPWTGDTRIGEQVLKAKIDDLRIPYEEKHDYPEVKIPDFNQCTRVEIQYQPSMLNYFFPYSHEPGLLNTEEINYLKSLQTIVFNTQAQIKMFAHDVSKGLPGGMLTQRSSAHVICYRDDERLTSFTIYDDRFIFNEENQCIRYISGLPSLKMLTSEIRPFHFRLECADNLRNLSELLKYLYNNIILFDIREQGYPEFKWCDYILNNDRLSFIPMKDRMSYLKCPSAGEGKCNYAMNPNCKYDSPPDMVLLFETKAGWNQHGGPELFTFDNHDPKGGCVLLNDGTVKFIRTKEELHQLRWK